MPWELLKNVSDKILELVLPIYCLGCEDEGSLLCEICKKRIYEPKQTCVLCGTESHMGNTHISCMDSKDSPRHFPIQVLSACDFTPKLAQIIVHELKYSGVKTLGAVCAKTMHDFWIAKDLPNHDSGWKISWIPIHPKKQLERGYNQAEIIAKHFGKLAGLDTYNTLIKNRRTESQTKLTKKQRVTNNAGSFSVAADVRDAKIILIDDVCTTGSTLLEASKVLLEAGAAQVRCLTFAKEP